MKLIPYVFQDAQIIYDDVDVKHFLWRYFFIPSFRIVTLMRVLQYIHIRSNIITRLLVSVGGGKLLNIRYIAICNRYCCFMPYNTSIDSGVSFPHNFPVVINPSSVIGKNCIIHPNVLIGTDRNKDGAPIIGDNVFIGDGCKIVGNCVIGNWCFLAPNAVVTKNIPEGSVVGTGINNIIGTNGKKYVSLYQSKNMQNER